MKKLILLLLPFGTIAQSVTISPNNNSAIIETNSTSKAVKMPSVATTTAITNPQKGMVVFDDATGTLSYFNGTTWIPLSNSTTGWAVSGNNLSNTNSGNVGIGNAAPNAKLHVKTGNSGASAPAFTNTIFENNTHNVVSILSPDDTQSGLIMQRPNSSGGVIYNTDESLGLVANGSTRMNIEANGNIGIGTSSPASKVHIVNGSSGQIANTSADLTVEDDATALIQMLSPQNNESGISFGLPSSLASGGVMYNNGGKKALQFRTRNNTTRMTIDSSGVTTISAGNGGLSTVNQTLKVTELGMFSDNLHNFNIVPLDVLSYHIEIENGVVVESKSSLTYKGEFISRNNNLICLGGNRVCDFFSKDLILKTKYSKLYYLNSVQYNDGLSNVKFELIDDDTNDIKISIKYFFSFASDDGIFEATLLIYGETN